MTTIFLGSSKAAKSQAKLVIDALTSEAVKFLPWWEAFPAGATLLERLNEIQSKVDGALFLFSPECEAVIRKQDKWIPNLNVLFEFGHFCEFPALWRHFVSGIKKPVKFRRNGATLFSA